VLSLVLGRPSTFRPLTFDEEVRGMIDAGRVRESDSALVISDPVRVG
jgi:hypothetical protein